MSKVKPFFCQMRPLAFSMIMLPDDGKVVALFGQEGGDGEIAKAGADDGGVSWRSHKGAMKKNTCFG